MSAAEGVSKLQPRPRLVPDFYGKGAQGGDEPELPGACTEGGINCTPGDEGSRRGGIVNVHEDDDPHAVVRNEVPDSHDEVDSLELMDGREGHCELGDVLFPIAVDQSEGFPTGEAGVTFDDPHEPFRGVETVPISYVAAEPGDIEVEIVIVGGF